jgi:hypothetical protein
MLVAFSRERLECRNKLLPPLLQFLNLEVGIKQVAEVCGFCLHILEFGKLRLERMKTLGPCDINLSRLNPTPHAIAVYASQPLSPVTTQHSLPSGRYSLLGPDFHRLDRTSLRLAHSFYDLVGAGEK